MKNCFFAAEILLPDFRAVDGSRWAAIACDQFTSEPEYWETADRFVGEAPSTLKLMLPEARLDRSSELTPIINKTMESYLESLLVCHKSSMIYVERKQSTGEIRRGIVGMIDLECYDYKKGSTSLVRATEGTVLERIPPRVAVRRDAAVELPHVMLLIDDPERSVVEPLADAQMKLAYDFELMLGGGHIKGQFLTEAQINTVSSALEALVTPTAIENRYGQTLDPLLFAVGDGNHSLASAKAHYEEIKQKLGDDTAKDHPARYALVEVVNLHDEALNFEPIYRVMFGVEPEKVFSELKKYTEQLCGNAKAQEIRCIGKDLDSIITVDTPVQQLAVGTLQTFIDDYIEKHPSVSVDYIHDEESTRKLASRDDAIGFLFDGMSKNELFKTVMLDGALPRKTFSMGHARDKRYYLESRKIK